MVTTDYPPDLHASRVAGAVSRGAVMGCGS
jgi:hypothetical protein